MKKIIALLALVGFTLQAATVSTSILPGGFTKVLDVNSGCQVTQIVLSAPTATNTSVSIIDTPTNSLTYVSAAYTNTISYATNWSYIYTNYYGLVVTNAYTNVLYQVTNNVVAANTNSYPVRVQASTLGGTSMRMDNVNYYFDNGIWATNSSTGPATVTITYRQ